MKHRLIETDFTGANLIGSDFTDAIVKLVCLTRATLAGVDLRESVSKNFSLELLPMRETNLAKANLSGKKFTCSLFRPRKFDRYKPKFGRFTER